MKSVREALSSVSVMALVIAASASGACQDREKSEKVEQSTQAIQAAPAAQAASRLRDPGPAGENSCSKGSGRVYPRAQVPPAPVLTAVGVKGPVEKDEDPAVKAAREAAAPRPTVPVPGPVAPRPLPARDQAYLAEVATRAAELEALDAPTREQRKAEIKRRHLGE